MVHLHNLNNYYNNLPKLPNSEQIIQYAKDPKIVIITTLALTLFAYYRYSSHQQKRLNEIIQDQKNELATKNTEIKNIRELEHKNKKLIDENPHQKSVINLLKKEIEKSMLEIEILKQEKSINEENLKTCVQQSEDIAKLLDDLIGNGFLIQEHTISAILDEHKSSKNSSSINSECSLSESKEKAPNSFDSKAPTETSSKILQLIVFFKKLLVIYNEPSNSIERKLAFQNVRLLLEMNELKQENSILRKNCDEIKSTLIEKSDATNQENSENKANQILLQIQSFFDEIDSLSTIDKQKEEIDSLIDKNNKLKILLNESYIVLLKVYKELKFSKDSYNEYSEEEQGSPSSKN